jgi:hypothetical protein
VNWGDRHGDWAQELTGRVTILMVSPEQWSRITGEPAPETPATPELYEEAGLPWPLLE